MPSPITIQKTVVSNVTHYKCNFCDVTRESARDCADHEWRNHVRQLTSTHTEYVYGEEVSFRYFPDESTFNAFQCVFCAVNQDWHEAGWYKVFTYRDSCMGCDMGDTTGLEHVDDDVSSKWITNVMRADVENIDIRFGSDMLADGGVEFAESGVGHSSIVWRHHSVFIADESFSIVYSRPEGAELLTNDDVIKAWRVWLSDR